MPEATRPERVLVVGYSYGSIVSAAACVDIPECIGFAVIAPPLDWYVHFALNLGVLEVLMLRATVG